MGSCCSLSASRCSASRSWRVGAQANYLAILATTIVSPYRDYLPNSYLHTISWSYPCHLLTTSLLSPELGAQAMTLQLCSDQRACRSYARVALCRCRSSLRSLSTTEVKLSSLFISADHSSPLGRFLGHPQTSRMSHDLHSRERP